ERAPRPEPGHGQRRAGQRGTAGHALEHATPATTRPLAGRPTRRQRRPGRTQCGGRGDRGYQLRSGVRTGSPAPLFQRDTHRSSNGGCDPDRARCSDDQFPA
nr:hypothetical protein [Tanacetum cinerariifolium]